MAERVQDGRPCPPAPGPQATPAPPPSPLVRSTVDVVGALPATARSSAGSRGTDGPHRIGPVRQRRGLSRARGTERSSPHRYPASHCPARRRTAGPGTPVPWSRPGPYCHRRPETRHRGPSGRSPPAPRGRRGTRAPRGGAPRCRGRCRSATPSGPGPRGPGWFHRRHRQARHRGRADGG